MIPLDEIRSPRVLYAKAVLFLVLGGMASGLLIAERPTLKVAGLLVLAVWAFARAYYFAFYVIEHYMDRDFRFSGLGSFARYLLRRRGPRPGQIEADDATPGDV